MTWNVPFESKTSRLCMVSVPATSMTPVHCPWDGIWRLSATLSVTLDGLSSVSLCLCVCHFDAHMVFFIALPSITVCMRTLSPFGTCSCTHLRYTWLRLSVVVVVWWSIASRRLAMGAGYEAISSCSVRRTDLEKKGVVSLFPGFPSWSFPLTASGCPFGPSSSSLKVASLGAGGPSSMLAAPPCFPGRALLALVVLGMLRIRPCVGQSNGWGPSSVGLV